LNSSHNFQLTFSSTLFALKVQCSWCVQTQPVTCIISAPKLEESNFSSKTTNEAWSHADYMQPSACTRSCKRRALWALPKYLAALPIQTIKAMITRTKQKQAGASSVCHPSP